MKTEAVKVGHFETEYRKYPRIQTLTIEDLFAGKKPQIPLPVFQLGVPAELFLAST